MAAVKGAFAMTLPGQLSEPQLAHLQQYGRERCEEIRLDASDPSKTIFAGVLRHPFASKKSAQTSFGLNLKAWGIVRSNRAARGWYRELSVAEYLAEFIGVDGQAGRRMQPLVSGILAGANRIALRHVAKAIAEQEKLEEENLKRERDAMRSADYESRLAAKWAADPEGMTEKARWDRDRSAMGCEDRWAQRIRHAESLPPPAKKPRHIHELPRPRTWYTSNRRYD